MILCVITSLLSGLRIHAASSNDWVQSIQWLLPQGEVYSLHAISGMVLIAVALYYFAMNFMLSRWNRVALVKELPLFSQTNLSRMGGIFGLALLLLSMISGMLLFIESQLLPFGLLVKLHFLSAIGFLLFLPLHPMLAWLAGGIRQLLRIFRPRFEYRMITMTMLGSSLLGAMLFFFIFSHAQSLLVVEQIEQALIEIDGEAREPEWQKARAVTVRTVKGANQPIGGVPVTIKAVEDGQDVYFYFRWPDPTRSLKHLPLIKTEKGWKVKQTAALRADENHFYEDQLAVMLSHSSEVAAARSAQLGPNPIADHPASVSGRGLHYTPDSSLLDVWHWKAVRTGLSIGQADDNYFGQARLPESESQSYNAGFHQDRDSCEQAFDGELIQSSCGGFVMNWNELTGDIIQPRRLPKNSSVLKQMGKIDLDPAVSDNGRWWMDWQDTVSYDLEQDSWPVGTVIPSVLSLGPFSQGRGGVTAGATWLNGYWHLEMKRTLKTDNQFDLSIENDMFLWVAVFDHSQTRHSYHLHPLRLRLASH